MFGTTTPRARHNTPLAATIAAAAAALGVHRQTIQDWIRGGAPGRRIGGGYDIDALRAWRRRTKSPRGSGGKWGRLLLREKSRLARLDRRHRESELVDRATMAQCVSIVLRQLGQLAAKAEKAFGPQASKLVTDAAADIRREAKGCIGDLEAQGPATIRHGDA
jgi:hypothetical protein